jgi:hypothetical protein
MVGNQENILVEFDYNNIIVVDPNKVIDENGKAKERLVKHEDMVMYANLECKVLPRTKLAVGVDNRDAIQTISVASINFLKPGGKTFLDNSYTDEITGKESLKGEGVNQPKSNSLSNPQKDDDFFVRQTITSGGKPGSVDNGLLGMTNISIRTNTSFLPRITVRLVDIKGKALFEGADNSPYAAFFNLPYPTFYLTIKGYYGKAVRLALMLNSFTSTYNSFSGNFDITLEFYTYKYTVLREISMGYLLATPHMYKSRVKIQTTQGNASQFSPVEDAIVERGYQKIKEMYSEFKSKGLIPDDFPEITIVQMQNRIENFVKNVLDSFTKENLDPLTYCEEYQKSLNNFTKDVYYSPGNSWFETYLDKKNFLVLNDKNKTKVYPFKKEFESKQKQEDTAIPKLKELIEKYKKILEENPTVGLEGSYTINGKTKRISIPFSPISYNIFPKEIQYSDIDYKETFIQIKGRQPADNELNTFEADIKKQSLFSSASVNLSDGDTTPKSIFYVFEGDKTFIDYVDNMAKQLKAYREEIENELTKALSSLLENKNSGIGFVPNIRNVLAVFFANGEAFLRLMDDVHRQSWEQRDNKIRKSVIFDKQVGGASQDNLSSGVDENTPVYPWPQLIVETTGENGQEKYEIRYPGDSSIINRTKGYLYDVWPEIEFVEEFIKGFVERTLPPADITANFDETNEIQRVSLNAVEFPIGNDVFSNKEEVKYFYEIYERILLTSFYSRLSRSNSLISDSDKITNLIAECENLNITKSLSNDNPFIIQKLKEYGFNANNFTLILRQFSNQGLGESWQNYIRGIFNTKYIKNKIENSSFEFLDISLFNNTNTQPLVSLPSENEFVEYIDDSTTSNKFDMLDIFPFTNTNWDKKYLANGTTILKSENSFNTTKTLTFDTSKKVICSFPSDLSVEKVRPITNFIYNEVNQPNVSYTTNLKTFYEGRGYNLQLPTEGDVKYFDYSGYVSSIQTTSIFNTPYFINSIQKGVENFRNNDVYPFVESAYLFLNSLPLSTLREKFKDDNKTTPSSATDLDYIYASLKKFGAIHKVPYAWILKIGSIWHRYKKFVNDGVDILDSVWTGTSYTTNFDPTTSAKTRNYGLIINGAPIDIVLQKDTTIGTELSTLINTGFYPKLINDFNLFYQGYNVIDPYLSVFGTASITNTTLTVTSLSSNNLQVGNIIEGAGIVNGTTITAQLTGPAGGIGTYTVNISQNTLSGSFNVTNSNIAGYSDTSIQNSIDNSGLTINYVQDAIIDLSEGFDSGNVNRDLRIIPWSVTVKSTDNEFCYIMPSNGSLLNQTKNECFVNDKIRIEVNDNQSVYDGSVRLFWAAPNYGYFDNGRLRKPNPDEYMKEILSGQSIQENFSINGTQSKYTKMSELLSVFEKQILDLFEQEFLNFSKSIYDYEPDNSENLTEQEKSYKNFQMLFRSFMKVPVIAGDTGQEIVEKLQQEQIKLMQPILKGFLTYDVIFKYGNPGNFDKKLFYTFSKLPLTDPYTWGSYTTTTPNSLPTNGGSVTLIDSQNQYPLEWSALKTYVGFSEISELVYSNNGSYITDFFIDLNIAFTVDNIVQFSNIIKVYATQKLNQFQPDPIPPTEPPVTNPAQSVALATLTNGDTISVIRVSGSKNYTLLRNSQGTILFEGLETIGPPSTQFYQQLVNETIIAVYGSLATNTGQTQNIVSFVSSPAPTYPQIPNPNSKQGINKFYETMSNYLLGVNEFIGKTVNNLVPKLQNSLPNVNSVAEGQVDSDLEGPATKVDLWESFKSLNDKWISGNDFSNKTFFEDVLLLDRASRNIGDKVLVDIYKLKNLLANINPKLDMMTMVESILVENHFVVMNIPSYVNFYNVQDAVKNPKPRAEGSLEFANTLFGTHMSVDYRDSSSKLVCFYGGKPSEILDIKNNVDYRYRNDVFDLRRASDNPLVEDLKNKNDWDKSNKVVGFNVDMGPQNQGVFTNFSVSQGSGVATAESLQVLNQMANQAGNRGGATQSLSLYNVYKNRSYNCNVQMLGNAMIQPTMYFNLRYVPMFSGPYMILEVTHNISPGVFETSFTGIRQPVAALPKIDNYLQSLKNNLLKSIIEKNKEKKKDVTKDSNGNVVSQSNNVTSNANGGKEFTQTNTCTPTVEKYQTFIPITPTIQKLAYSIVKGTIQQLISVGGDDGKLKYAVFVALYLESGNSTGFEAYENNFAGIDLNQNWGNQSQYFDGNKQFFCLKGTDGNTKPYAVFDDLSNNVKVLIDRWKLRTSEITTINGENLFKFWVINFGANTSQGNSIYNQLQTQPSILSEYQSKAQKAIDIWNSMSNP